jgi:hypothetical protein
MAGARGDIALESAVVAHYKAGSPRTTTR